MQTIDRETRLIEEAREGCAESFRQLVQNHHKVLRFYISRFIYCPESVDDVAQEVFLQAFKHLSRFRGDASFSTWLIGIARLKSLEHLRAKRKTDKVRRDLLLANQMESQFENLQRSCLEFEQVEDRLQTLTSCVAELPERSMSLVKLCYFDQLSSAEIAEVCQCKSSTVRMRLHRIREVLRKCVEKKSGRLNS